MSHNITVNRVGRQHVAERLTHYGLSWDLDATIDEINEKLDIEPGDDYEYHLTGGNTIMLSSDEHLNTEAVN